MTTETILRFALESNRNATLLTESSSGYSETLSVLMIEMAYSQEAKYYLQSR